MQKREGTHYMMPLYFLCSFDVKCINQFVETRVTEV